MTTRHHYSQYFYGNKISDYGISNGYVDYHTFAKAFDAVLVNDITKLFYSTVNGEYSEPEQVNGIIDNSEIIDEKRKQIDVLAETMQNAYDDAHVQYLQEQIDKIQEQIDELENEQDYPPEIYQYFIVSDNGAQLIQKYTNDPLLYIPVLDCYVWGITHFGTSWSHVLTDIKIKEEN